MHANLLHEYGEEKPFQARPGAERRHLRAAGRGAEAGPVPGEGPAEGIRAQKFEADLTILMI